MPSFAVRARVAGTAIWNLRRRDRVGRRRRLGGLLSASEIIVQDHDQAGGQQAGRERLGHPEVSAHSAISGWQDLMKWGKTGSQISSQCDRQTQDCVPDISIRGNRVGPIVSGGKAGRNVAATGWAACQGTAPRSIIGESTWSESLSMQPTDSPNVRRRRVWPWLVGAPVLLVLVLVTLAVVVFWPRADSQLAKAMAVADQDDPNWRLDDLMAHREWVADEENSAIVLARVIELLPRNWPSDPPPPPGGFRPPKNAVANALDGLHATKANVRLEDSIASVLRSELKTHAEAVAIARTVADYRRGRHELVIGPTVIDTLLPETQAVRSVARLLDADAAVRAYEGDLDGALDSCRAIIGAGRSIGDEPTLISTLVHIAIDSTAMSATRRVLAQGEPSDAASSAFKH